MIAYTDDFDTESTATTNHYDSYRETSSDSTFVHKSPGVYIIYSCVDIKSNFDDDFFDWLWLKKEASRREGVYWNEIFVEHFYRVQIALIFNTYSALFNRRMMFPKSGFLARAGRRKRN
jgi:hypothetical protein